MTNLASSGIYVFESPSQGQSIATYRQTVVAFIGPTPRGPVDVPVPVTSVDEFRKRFSSPNHTCGLETALQQFFDNGGSLANVVRIARSPRRNRIELGSPANTLVLEAVNPGPLEYLRASIDLDNIEESDPDRFNLVVQRLQSSSQPLVEEQESYMGVSLRPHDNDFLGEHLLESNLVRLYGDAPAIRPEPTVSSDLTGGSFYEYSDAAWPENEVITDYDLIGSATHGTGLHALDQIPIVDLICILPGVSEGDVGLVALFTAERYCRQRNAMLLVDPPTHWRAATDIASQTSEVGFVSPNVITYYPRLQMSDRGSAVRCVSAAGAIAGRIAFGDSQYGIHRSLGLTDAATLRSRCRPAENLTDEQVRILARSGVNSLVHEGPGRINFRGHVTFASSHGLAVEWNSLSKRRLALFIQDSISRGTRWAAFHEKSIEVLSELRSQIAEFLTGVWEAGALPGQTSAEAFYVKCDMETNAPAGFDQNGMNFIVGIALNRPSEFIAFRFTQRHSQCKISELGWQPGLARTG